MSTKKSLYNVAINSQGFMLLGSPKRPSRVMSEAPKLGEIPQNLDFDYAQASPLWLPWAQTDWSGGFQAEKWRDDATFREGVNIEPIASYGQITLQKDVTAVKNDFADGHTFGAGHIFNDRLYVGTSHATTAQLWNLQSDDTDTQVTTGWSAITDVNDFDVYQDKLIFALSRSSGSEATVETYDGSSMADVRTDSDNARMVKVLGDRIYVGEENSTATDGDTLIYSDDGGTNWNTIISKTGQNREISKGTINFGILYFLIVDGTRVELWQVEDVFVDPIYTFEYLSDPDIHNLWGRVFISGKDENGLVQVWEWTGAQLIPSFIQSITNTNMGSQKLCEFEGNLHIQGLVYDGKYWFPSHEHNITSGSQLTPFASFGSTTDGRLYFYGTDSGSDLDIYKTTTTYVTSGTCTVGNFFGNKPSINKLWNDVSINFKALAAGESIAVSYSTDDGSNFTSLGTVDYATYGAVSNWIFTFDNVQSRKLILKFTLTAGTSQATTPTLLDYVVGFRPVGDDKYRWILGLNCSDKIQLMDKDSQEPKSGVELRNLLRVASWDNLLVDFEDVDYVENQLNGALTYNATTITVDDTAKFPEQGRLRIENEEITYTGKTPTTFTGCTRGSRGTIAVAHSDNTAVNNIYKVFISKYEERLPVANDSQSEEYQVVVTLVEK